MHYAKHIKKHWVLQCFLFLAVLFMISVGFKTTRSDVEPHTNTPGNEVNAQNWDTQINFISDSTLTRAYLNESKLLRINGPLGSTVHSFRVILVPASGTVKAFGIEGDTITSPIRTQIRAINDLEQLLIDQTIVTRYGKQEQLNPAYYTIVEPAD